MIMMSSKQILEDKVTKNETMLVETIKLMMRHSKNSRARAMGRTAINAMAEADKPKAKKKGEEGGDES